MWYSSMFSLSTPSKENSTASQQEYNFTFCLALSDDGIVWRKPELGIVDYSGSRANNILLRGQDLYGASVVHDPATSDVGAQDSSWHRLARLNALPHPASLADLVARLGDVGDVDFPIYRNETPPDCHDPQLGPPGLRRGDGERVAVLHWGGG